MHLFTLGALTPLIVTFMPRFASALLHARPVPDRTIEVRVGFAVVGAAGVIAGRVIGNSKLIAAGAIVLSIAVGWLYVHLRTLRRRALPARFNFVVRAYERACGAFLHGAILGGLLGAAVLPGTWHYAARAAHIQLMLLGWGGLTLLGTIITFGPAMMRARIRDGAEATAGRALKRAAVAVSVAAWALLLTGAGGSIGTIARFAAGGALAVYAGSVARCTANVLAAARRAAFPAARFFVAGACSWFVAASVLNALATLAQKPAWTDAAVIALLSGVFLQSILATMLHVVPLIAGRDAGEREALSARVALLSGVRAAVLSAGAALASAGAMTGAPAGESVSRAGWALIAVAVVATLTLFGGAIVSLRLQGSRTSAVMRVTPPS